tara:strand:- start:43 stop:303 length:261 start_codon:yes stop_codon:yes gene_type:complete
MTTIDQFRKMINSLDDGVLADLCEQFVYDHEGAIKATIKFATDSGLLVNPNLVKDFITEMHQKGEFDHVECWGLELGANDLYKKFH